MFFSSRRSEKKSTSRLSSSSVKDRDSPGTERTRERDKLRDRKEQDRTRDRDRDRDGQREKDVDSPRDKYPSATRARTSSSRVPSASSSSPRAPERRTSREKAHRTVSHSSSGSVKMASVVPEMQRRASAGSPDVAKPSSYPTFSKAHSKESVGSREDAVNPRISLYTPNTTDLGKASAPRPATTGAAPPSPPLTATTDMRRVASANSMRAPVRPGAPSPVGRNSADAGPRHVSSNSRLRKTATADSSPSASPGSSKSKARRPTSKPAVHTAGSDITERTMETTESDATSVAPPRAPSVKLKPAVSDTTSSPASAIDSSPCTPAAHEAPPRSPEVLSKGTPMVEVLASGESVPFSPNSMPANTSGPPPPPPPMPQMPQHPPKVDYLLQYGGLPHVVPRSLLAGVSPIATLVGQQANGTSKPTATSPSVSSIFAPLNNVLDSYNQVMLKDGSIAVATGYRSVARRLLDRLEAVFARNISSETCPCIMCKSAPPGSMSPREDTGVSWGEILEYVAGRRDLPTWPPFSISSTNSNPLGISGAEPMQKLDIDVPEEYREHYIRQSKKTKTAVQSWLAAQPDFPSSPPQEVDDETLTFAILTHLDPEKRPLYHALLRGLSTLPSSRAPTPLHAAKGEMIPKTALAIQRLYRLERSPRDAECTIFLLNNPQIHAVLATVAAVSPHEWEILTSGRFDGFLWSGADSAAPAPGGTPSPLLSRSNPSRGPLPHQTTPATGQPRCPTPYYAPQPRWPSPHCPPSRGPTPGGQSVTSQAQSQMGAPVQLDEDTELAALAEVEREIYLGMEALEDAFEALHNKAELVRTALRMRSAGLAAAAQHRRGSTSNIEVRMGTPASQASAFEGYDGQESVADFLNDAMSELAPDDSASNVGFRDRKRHRVGRESRKQRRTPAPVEEELDTSDVATDVTPREKPSRRKK